MKEIPIQEPEFVKVREKYKEFVPAKYWVFGEQVPINLINVFVNSLGEVARKKNGILIKYKVNNTKNNYPNVTLNKAGVKVNALTIHKIVASTFLERQLIELIAKKIPHRQIQVDHINGNTYDYTLVNLEWVTQSENMKRALGKKDNNQTRLI